MMEYGCVAASNAKSGGETRSKSLQAPSPDCLLASDPEPQIFFDTDRQVELELVFRSTPLCPGVLVHRARRKPVIGTYKTLELTI